MLLAAPARAAEPPLVAFLGDSLTAGLGLPASDAWPSRLAERLAKRGRPIRVLNGGVSGDTSAGGARRVGWLLRQKPDLLVVALGANDGLRGLPIGELEKNLESIVGQGKRAGAKVLLLGLRVPPNLGVLYAESFAGAYARVAKRQGVPLVPFFLEGVAGVAGLNQSDGIHPNGKGQAKIAERVEEPVLDALR